MIAGKPKYKEKLIENNLNECEDQFIFYNNQKEIKFEQQVEIQATLNSNTSHKVMVIIDRKSTLDYLCIKIAEQMEKFCEYANLEGLKATNLTKKSEKGVLKIPRSGELKDYLTGGDVIYCDLTTSEYWIKTNIKVFSNYNKVNISLDLKFNIETPFRKLKFLLMKLGVNFWVDYSKGTNEHFHFTFVSAKFKTVKSKNSFECNISDINKSASFESVAIKDVFDFTSEISCQVYLASLEELLFNELKNATLDSSSMNQLRMNEFRELSFDSLVNDRKFNPEKVFIMKYIRRLIRTTHRSPHPSFYVYNKNYVGKDEDDFNAINENESANLIIAPASFHLEINEFVQTNRTPVRKKRSGVDGREHKSPDGEDNYPSQEEDENDNDDNFKDPNLREENHIKSRHGKSFLEQSKIIHDFQKRNGSFIESSHKDPYCSSFENDLLTKPYVDFPNTNTNTIRKICSVNNLPTEKSNVYESEISEANIYKEEIDHDIKKSNPMPSTAHVKKFSSIFTKMRDTSKYSNLCTEFKLHLKAKSFLEVIETYSTLKMNRNTLEKAGIPQFRDINIQSEAIDTETRDYSLALDQDDSPISVNNKRILLFVLILFTIFIGAILFIFLSE